MKKLRQRAPIHTLYSPRTPGPTARGGDRRDGGTAGGLIHREEGGPLRFTLQYRAAVSARSDRKTEMAITQRIVQTVTRQVRKTEDAALRRELDGLRGRLDGAVTRSALETEVHRALEQFKKKTEAAGACPPG